MSNWGRSDGVSPFQKVSWEQAQRERAIGYVLIHFDALPDALSGLRLPIMHGLRGGITGIVNLHSLSIFEAATEARKDLKEMNIDVDKL